MLKLLYERRSIRNYKEVKIEKEKLNKLIEAALLSPSSRGNKPWEFIVIDDPVIIKKLSRAKKSGSEFLKKSPLMIVILADEEKSDVWIEDCSIASTIIQLEAQSLDLGSCWVQIRNRNHSDEITSEEYVRKVLSIPSSIRVESIIGIGYPDEEKSNYTKQDLDMEKVHKNSYK